MSSSDPDVRGRVAATAACTVPGLLVRLTGGVVPAPMQVLVYGVAVVAAAFLLAWACEAAQVDVAHGVVVAAVAFVAILPEYVVEVHFAFTAQVAFVSANLTGASRLLLGCAIALPAAAALLPQRMRVQIGRLELAPPHRIELAILALGSLWTMRAVFSGRLTLLDGVVLVGLYGLYLRRVGTAGGESPEPMGVAAALAALPRDRRRRWAAGLMGYAALVILLTAVPFGDAVLASGAVIGISPYLMLQWIVPLATETPELVVASVLLAHERGGQSIAVLLAGAVSQYTLALGTLPVAYAAGAGTGPLPVTGPERIELLLTLGVALYAVAALATLRLSRGDSSIMLALFAGQLILPASLTRLAFAIVFIAVAVDVLLSERRALPALAAALRPPRVSGSPPAGAGPSSGPAPTRPARSHTRSRAAAGAARFRRP